MVPTSCRPRRYDGVAAQVAALHLSRSNTPLIVTALNTELDLVHEAYARFFERDRSCWKARLRSAWFTNACERRSSSPFRKVIENPVQSAGQAASGWTVMCTRHISIMRLLSLGYEHHDARLPRLRRSGASR
jgi:hypothetical protein